MKKFMVILIGVFLAGSVYAGDVKGNYVLTLFSFVPLSLCDWVVAFVKTNCRLGG